MGGLFLGLAVGAAAGAGAVFGLLPRRKAREVPIHTSDEHDVPSNAVAAVFEALPVGAAILSGEDVLTANASAGQFGLLPGAVLPDAALIRLVRLARRSGTPTEAELDLVPTGSREALAVHVAWCPTTTDDYAVLMLQDVSETRRVDTVRRDFVANVSHELQTPIGALALLAEALSDGTPEPALVRDFADRMRKEAQRLAHLVKDLLELSRIEGAASDEGASPVSMDAIVSEAVDRSTLAADAAGVRLVTADPSQHLVRGNEPQLVTALVNLIDNAVAYSSAGSTVRIGIREQDGEVAVAVSDEGIGISPADVDRVFERFYRVDPARSRATGGTGLGLSIVKHIVGNHGGRVSVWSSEGVGSTFTLHLPAGAVPVAVGQ